MKDTLYRNYLAATLADQRLAALELKIRSVTFSTFDGLWRRNFERDIDQGEQPNLYRFGEVQIRLIEPAEDYSLTYAEREKVAQEWREEQIRRIAAAHSDVKVARFDGDAVIFFEAFEGLGVTLNMGKAMCERVLVREDFIEVPDPALLAEATSTIPLVKKAVPVYEYRCNDAELSAF